MNIRSSMCRVVFAWVVLPFLLFALLLTNIYSGRLEKVIVESLHVVANSQIEVMSRFCEQQQENLTILGKIDLSRAAMKGELAEVTVRYLDNVLDSRVQTMEYLKTLALINREHRVVACSDPDHPLFVGTEIDSLLADMGAQSFYISDVLTDGQGKKMVVAISKIEDNGVILGYALAEINLDFYESIRERAVLWEESTFYLLDGKQQIISVGTPKEARDAFVTTAEEREDYNNKYNAINFEQNPQGSFQYRIGGTDYLTYYSDVAHTNWRVLLTVDMAEYQTERTVYFMLAAILVLLCVLLAFWISRFVSRQIVCPVQRMADTLVTIREKRDYSLRITVGRKNELGSLAEEINALVDLIETETIYQNQRQRLLQEKAEHDALTKAMNKERIRESLQEAIERHRADSSTMAVLFVDVDDFKAFNTNYGHNVGDQVLLFIVSLLEEKTGGTVGRIGGDEFLVVMEIEDRKKLESCLKQVEEAAESRFVIRGEGIHLPISCSIGTIWIDFALDDTQDLTPEQLIGMADRAMYQVKNNGKRGYVILNHKLS